ncbi:BnaA03g47000D [Brassica napus]|uniref:BnaA03g47000D protein n=1 Tax=Brassica napus TaxID=3708 RepID=A0A078FCK9_BRANA|nr:BnaA03g47000D [Brassica napus]
MPYLNIYFPTHCYNHLITRARPLIILFAKTPNGKRAQACRNRGKSSSKDRF